MRSRTTRRFREAFEGLPDHIKQRARAAYRLFGQDPYHPSLRFRQVHPTRPIFSVRITRDYRALGLLQGDEIVRFWIGAHSDYDHLLSRL